MDIKKPEVEVPGSLESKETIESRVTEAMATLGVLDGLVERVMSALPDAQKMKPMLHPALRVAYGLMSVAFAFTAWKVDMPARFGIEGVSGKILLGVFFAQAAFGATLIGLLLWREQRGALRVENKGAAFEPLHARRMLAAVGFAIIFGMITHLLGGMKSAMLGNAIRLARMASISLMFTTIGVAALQLYFAMRGRDFARQMRMVEAGGLFASGLICAFSAFFAI